jgi:hypothetical protein
MEGAGVHLNRVFGYNQLPELDPFLLLDDFRGDRPEQFIKGFPWHPHRGIETITYMLYGTVEHGDSLENRGVIGPGDVQWMTAGSGIIHQEMPQPGTDGRMGGFQLWANLPASQKMSPPRYQEIKSAEVPVKEISGGITLKIIAGTLEGVTGPVKGVAINPVLADVTVPSGRTASLSIPADHKIICYLFEGGGWFDAERDPLSAAAAKSSVYTTPEQCEITANTGLLLGDGDRFEFTAGSKGMRFLLIAGVPINEPIAWHGPIVMNTQEELNLALSQLRDGTFLKQ